MIVGHDTGEIEQRFCRKTKVKVYLHIALQSSCCFLAFCHLILCTSFQMEKLVSGTFTKENIWCDSELAL